MEYNWHKIDWEKTNKVFEPIKEYSDGDDEYWDHLEKLGMKYVDDNKEERENWESFLKAGWPTENADNLLLYFEETDEVMVGYYDDDNAGPVFWSNDHDPILLDPSHWCEIEKPLKQ